jgi:hypothetical protein
MATEGAMAATGQHDPGNADFSSRLVVGIKAAMGENSVDGGAPASSKLRALYIAGAAAMLALWGLSLVPVIQNWNNPNEDGFSFVPAFWAAITLLPLGLLTLLGGIAGRGKSLRRARKTFVIGVALLALLAALEILRRMSNAAGA